MVVCSFFLKGNCRFGDRCRNEHPGPSQNVFNSQSSFGGQSAFGQNKSTSAFGGGNKNTGFNRNQNRFSALSNESSIGGQSSAFGKNQQQLNTAASVDPNNQSQVTQIQGIVRRDMEVWETSNQWPLSCYTFLKEEPCLPGLVDFSFEEIRKEAYDAKTSNTAPQYQQGLKSLIEKSKQRRMELKNVNLHQLQSDIKAAMTNTASESSSMSFGASSQSGSMFGGASTMSQSQGMFGGTSTLNQPPGVFGNTTATSQSTGLFGATTATSQSTGLFGATSATNQSQGLFGASTGMSGAGLFGAAQKPFGSTTNAPVQIGSTNPGSIGTSTGTSLFGSTGKSVFGANTTAPSTGALLFGAGTTGTTASPFGSTTATGQPGIVQQSTFGNTPALSGQSSNTTSTTATSTTTLKSSEEDLAAFNGDHFVLGKIPEHPPPPEFCA